MHPIIMASLFFGIIFTAISFIQGIQQAPRKNSPKVQALPVAFIATALMLTGYSIFGGVESLTGIFAQAFGSLEAPLLPSVSALGTAFAMGAAAPSSEKLLTLNELAELDAPFAAESSELFASVRDHDFETLAARCDDDFGIIDINTGGGSEIIRNRAEWENWFTNLFKQLDAMQAKTDTLIAKYDAVDWGDTGMSVVEFAQMLEFGGKTGRFNVIVTIVWKKVEGRWVEARWHSSLVSTELPEGFGA